MKSFKTLFSLHRASFMALLFTVNLAMAQEVTTELLRQTLEEHKAFVSLPNISTNEGDMLINMEWAKKAFERQNFTVELLETSSLPIFFAEHTVSKKAKTILYYFHIDGQAVNPASWDQDDPFTPVLKKASAPGEWEQLDWQVLDEEIDPEWRIFGRAAADDKAPIMMFLAANQLMADENIKHQYNIKVLIDPQEESRSTALQTTLDQYKETYAADYMIIMDGPAHPTNKPTLTYGFRGNSSCSIKVYGAKLPQHSGHYGNYAPNPVFTLAHLLASMKKEDGVVLIDGFYDGIDLTPEIKNILAAVPDDQSTIQKGLGIAEPEQVGNSYQEALQYPSLNVRQFATSWTGPGLKTIIPEYAVAYLDVRLVVETDGAVQLEKVRQHIIDQGFLVIDRAPTDEERISYPKIVTFTSNAGSNAYRADMNGDFGKQLYTTLD